MKFFKKLIPFLCVLLLLPGALNACSIQKKDTIKTIRIGVSVYRKDDTFIASLSSYLEEDAKKREQQTGNKIILNIMDSQSSQSLQNDQVDGFLSKNYDAVCVNMVDRTAAATIVDKAKKADTPLIFFNREPVEEDIQMWGKAYYVGADAAQSGTLQGQIIARAYKKDPRSIDRNGDGKIQYVMLEGEQGHQDSLLRTEYSVKAVEESGVHTEMLANDTANWQRAQATAKMKQWITRYGGRIEAVLCNNDDMALGAIDAIRESGWRASRPVVVGVDGTAPGLDAIKNGTMLGSAYNNAKTQAEVIFGLCCDPAGTSKSFPLQRGHFIYIPYQMITRENAGKFG
jgi:methyl-galactoside transport system substrate-binding protein